MPIWSLIGPDGREVDYPGYKRQEATEEELLDRSLSFPECGPWPHGQHVVVVGMMADGGWPVFQFPCDVYISEGCTPEVRLVRDGPPPDPVDLYVI